MNLMICKLRMEIFIHIFLCDTEQFQSCGIDWQRRILRTAKVSTSKIQRDSFVQLKAKVSCEIIVHNILVLISRPTHLRKHETKPTTWTYLFLKKCHQKIISKLRLESFFLYLKNDTKFNVSINQKWIFFLVNFWLCKITSHLKCIFESKCSTFGFPCVALLCISFVSSKIAWIFQRFKLNEETNEEGRQKYSPRVIIKNTPSVN